MRLALSIAVGLHAALFGVSALVDLGQRLHIEIKVPEAAPIEVDFVSPPPPPAPAATTTTGPTSATASTGTPHRGHAQIVASVSTATSGIEVPGPGPETTQNPYMRMRGTDLGLASESAARIVESPGHELPAAPHHSGKLENVSGGEAVIHDRVTTMSIEKDGSAHFADKPDIDLKLKLPIPHIDIEGMRKDLGNLITDWYADPYAGTRYGRTSELPNHILAAPGACDDWGSIWCDDPLAPKSEREAREQAKTNGSIAGGPADITAYLMRKTHVGDPYASRKLKLLDDTREERVERGTAFRTQQLVRSAELIERNIARAAQLTGRDRHIALFELWDECSEGDDAEGHAGQRARAQVIGWIRANLPKGSADAFTDDEITELAARKTSHQPFEPY